MFNKYFLLVPLLFVVSYSLAQDQEGAFHVVPLYKGTLNKNTTTVKAEKQQDGATRTGVVLRNDIYLKAEEVYEKADVEVELKIHRPGWYVIEAETAPENLDLLKKRDTTGRQTLWAKFQHGNARLTKRIVYDIHKGGKQELGKFEFSGKKEILKVWLPENLIFYSITIRPYLPPVAPHEAETYEPKIVPPDSHPRLWVTPQTLPLVKARLATGENKQAWSKVRDLATVPFRFDFDPRKEMFYDEELEKAAEMKAFYYLMTGDKKVGKEAVRLMANYLSVLEFSNVTYGDISREIGRAIYRASLVYDWCHDLMKDSDRQAMYKHLVRLARNMEIGWPPFHGLESIVNGHGNEAQLCRDLLSMSIAVYDEDPEPYKYTAYAVLEQLVPMRKFEYQSPRHNQGVDYGAYRFGWEMHAAWLFFRMSGISVFDDSIKELPYYWLYMRLPDGYMLRDGDMFSAKFGGERPLYWKQPQTMLLSYAYAHAPLIKGEFERQSGLPDDPVLFLLVNDPGLKADHDLSSLPLTKNFGSVLGSIVARTGWDNSENSRDVIAEIKGGGYHFANHQQADAGALQIYHHGIQVGDLGLYLSYGSAYDFNFNKRSIAHSMMLAVDPDEKLLFRAKFNDGGTRFNQRFPRTPQETISDPWFDNGKVLSAAFGPSQQKPAFSYFKADLTGAYTAKMSHYTRGFCFLNLDREDVPAAIVLTDDMTTSKPEFEKFWQINTLNTPELADSVIILHNEQNGLAGKTHVDMLVPSSADRHMEILSGRTANGTFGQQFEVNSKKPEANGHRIMISPKEANKRDRFLTVFQMAEGDAKPLPIDFRETDERYQVILADRIVSMSSSSDVVRSAFTVEVPADTVYQVILTGMKAGFWNVKSTDSKIDFNSNVLPGKNTLFFTASGGQYVISPERSYEASESRREESPVSKQ